MVVEQIIFFAWVVAKMLIFGWTKIPAGRDYRIATCHPLSICNGVSDQARTNKMTLSDAFHDLTIEQVEKALAADEPHGFPQDVFGLARLMLRTFSVLAPDSVKLDGSSADLLETDRAIEQRIAGMLELERLKASQFDEDESFVDWHSDTRH